jgi:hypothetical protein
MPMPLANPIRVLLYEGRDTFWLLHWQGKVKSTLPRQCPGTLHR